MGFTRQRNVETIPHREPLESSSAAYMLREGWPLFCRRPGTEEDPSWPESQSNPQQATFVEPPEKPRRPNLPNASLGGVAEGGRGRRGSLLRRRKEGEREEGREGNLYVAEKGAGATGSGVDGIFSGWGWCGGIWEGQVDWLGGDKRDRSGMGWRLSAASNSKHGWHRGIYSSSSWSNRTRQPRSFPTSPTSEP